MMNKINEYINKEVDVYIDRPLGSHHPHWNFIDPLNYGYLPNTINADGEEIDCYVLGVFKPVTRIQGKCIAIIHRIDDDDDKLIVSVDERDYSDDAIIALTEFQERFFDIRIIR